MAMYGSWKTFLQVILALLIMLAGSMPVAWGNEWVDRGGLLNPGGGWFQWVQNTVDGRYCALTYGGDLQCYDTLSNVLETVYVDGSQTLDPNNGDLQVFGWDHVHMEYLAMDGGRSIGPNPMAFSMVTRTWRLLTNVDFDGVESRTIASGAGSATSPDHDLFVVFAGGNYGSPGRKTLIYDLQNRTYSELDGPSSMPSRNHTQGQFLYIPSLRGFLLFGGDSPDSGPYNDLWFLDIASWTWMSVTAHNSPSGRSFGQMAYDPLNDVVYLYGGIWAMDGSVSVLHLSSWTWEHLPEPPGTLLVDYPGIRRVGAGIYDPIAGFCSGAGTLAGTNWVSSAKIWCWTHSFDGSPLASSLSLMLTGTGQGSVAGGINCSSGTCAGIFPQGSKVTLNATPDNGNTFWGWSGGGCSGTGSCEVVLSTSLVSVTATFEPSPLSLPLSGGVPTMDTPDLDGDIPTRRIATTLRGTARNKEWCVKLGVQALGGWAEREKIKQDIVVLWEFGDFPDIDAVVTTGGVPFLMHGYAVRKKGNQGYFLLQGIQGPGDKLFDTRLDAQLFMQGAYEATDSGVPTSLKGKWFSKSHKEDQGADSLLDETCITSTGSFRATGNGVQFTP